MDLNRVKLYRYANNYVQEQINHYEFVCGNSNPKSDEYQKALKYLIYWRAEYKRISDDEREEIRRDK